MFRWASALFICFAIPSLACALDPRAAFERGDYVSASEEWKRLAEKGDPKAQHNLGLLFDQGLGVEQDYEQAAIWFQQASDNGIGVSQYKLAMYHYLGKGVPFDLREAKRLFSLANESLTDDESKAVATRYHDLTSKFLLINQMSEQGHVGAQVSAAKLFYGVEGVEFHQDYTLAADYFQKAAKQNHSEAQYFMGVMYLSGRGVQKDLTKGMAWILEAAERGHSEAQKIIGIAYSRGDGSVPLDVSRAYKWLDLAATGGSNDAGGIRDELSLRLTPKQITEGQRQVQRWKPKPSWSQDNK